MDGSMFEIQAPNADSTLRGKTISGLIIDCLPDVSGQSIKLVSSITEVENVPTTLAVSPSAKTEFVAGCRVMIENGGAMVIELGHRKSTTFAPSFIIVSPYLINPDGTRIVDNPKSSK